MIMRHVLAAVAAVLLIITSVHARQKAFSSDTPEGIVYKLYLDYAWEAVVATGPEGVMQQPQAVLEQYFDHKLVLLILKDRACAEKEEGVCGLDFSPMWDSQDPSASDLTVERTKKPDVIAVTFRYPSTNEKIELKYVVIKTAKGWRINDIRGKSWSLVSILSSPN